MPKLNKGGYSCLNVEGLDNIITMMKGKRRMKTWGSFYNMNKSIADIETKNIQELDLNKVEYNDLPVKDTGEMIESLDFRGKPMEAIPSFVKRVFWEFCYRRMNYFYVDEFRTEYILCPNFERKQCKIMVCRGRRILNYQIKCPTIFG